MPRPLLGHFKDRRIPVDADDLVGAGVEQSSGVAAGTEGAVEPPAFDRRHGRQERAEKNGGVRAVGRCGARRRCHRSAPFLRVEKGERVEVLVELVEPRFGLGEFFLLEGLGLPDLECVARGDEIGGVVQPDLRAELLGENDAPGLIDAGLQRLTVEEPLEHPPLHRAAGKIRDLGIDLGGGVHRVAFEVGPAMVAIDDDEFGLLAFGPERIAGFEDATEMSRDRYPPLSVHLLVEFASEPANHCPAVPSCLSTGTKTADRAAATARSAALVPFLGARLRVPPGGMSARPRAGSLGSMKRGACMKPAWGVWSLALRCSRSSWEQGCHGISW